MSDAAPQEEVVPPDDLEMGDADDDDAIPPIEVISKDNPPRVGMVVYLGTTLHEVVAKNALKIYAAETGFVTTYSKEKPVKSGRVRTIRVECQQGGSRGRPGSMRIQR